MRIHLDDALALTIGESSVIFYFSTNTLLELRSCYQLTKPDALTGSCNFPGNLRNLFPRNIKPFEFPGKMVLCKINSREIGKRNSREQVLAPTKSVQHTSITKRNCKFRLGQTAGFDLIANEMVKELLDYL